LKIEKIVKKAMKKNVDVLVFPEYVLTGPTSGKKEFVDFDGKFVKIFQELAKKYRVDIVTGSWVEARKKKRFNTSYYIDHNGKILGRYEKINLWHSEKGHLKPGKKVSVFNTRFGKTGLAICWDLSSPEIFKKMLKKGAEIVYCPSYWCDGDSSLKIMSEKKREIRQINALCISRSFENSLILAFCNVSGKHTKKSTQSSIGNSQVCVPAKGVLKKIKTNKQTLLVCEVDTEVIKTAEKVYKLRNGTEA